MRNPALISLCLLLLSCGGGGGDTDARMPQVMAPPTINAAAAWQSLMWSAGTWQVSGQGSDNARYDVKFTLTPAQDTSIIVRGTPTTFAVTDFSTIVNRNGATTLNSVTRIFLNKHDLAVGALLLLSSNECGIVQSSTPIPESTAAGTSGAIFTAKIYPVLDGGCGGPLQMSIETLSSSWSYDTSTGVPLFCVTNTDQFITAESNSICVEVGAAGALGPRARFTSTSSSGGSLVATNF